MLFGPILGSLDGAGEMPEELPSVGRRLDRRRSFTIDRHTVARVRLKIDRLVWPQHLTVENGSNRRSHAAVPVPTW